MNKTQSNQIKSSLLLLLAAVVWGGAFVAQSLASNNPVIFDENELAEKSDSLKSENNVQPASVTPGLFSDEEIIISEILSTDTDNLTPINALQTIARWKKTLSGQ